MICELDPLRWLNLAHLFPVAQDASQCDSLNRNLQLERDFCLRNGMAPLLAFELNCKALSDCHEGLGQKAMIV